MSTVIQKFCAWLWKFETFRFCMYHHTIPDWVGHYVMNQLSDQSWKNGFEVAVTELFYNCTVMLEGVPRMIAARTDNFSPQRPQLLVSEPMFYDDWDAGYERAIILWRLALVPEQLMRVKHVLATRRGVPSFDGLIRFVLEGEMRIDPREWRNRKGQFLPARQAYQLALHNAYHDYTEKYQQVRAAHLLKVENECFYCTETIDSCICREETK